MVFEALLVLQLGEAAAQRQDPTAEVAVRRKLAAEVLRRPAVEQVAAARTLSIKCTVFYFIFITLNVKGKKNLLYYYHSPISYLFYSRDNETWKS